MNTPDSDSDSGPANLILCGFMGTGKTTIGRILAGRLGWRFVDTDTLIEQRQNRSVQEIFKTDGEPAFRQLESDLCAEIVGWRETVIATGGGIVLNPLNRVNLQRAGLVVCLNASTTTLVSRLSYSKDRPLLAGTDAAQRIFDLLHIRAEAYAALPYQIDTTDCSPLQVAQVIADLWYKTTT